MVVICQAEGGVVLSEGCPQALLALARGSLPMAAAFLFFPPTFKASDGRPAHLSRWWNSAVVPLGVNQTPRKASRRRHHPVTRAPLRRRFCLLRIERHVYLLSLKGAFFFLFLCF